MKDIKYIRDYYNKYYTDKLQSLFEKTLILQAFKPYENDKRQGKWLSKQMDIKGDEKILECGCGIGGVMKQLATLHPNTDIHGINISDGQLKIAEGVLKDLDNLSSSHLVTISFIYNLPLGFNILMASFITSSKLA